MEKYEIYILIGIGLLYMIILVPLSMRWMKELKNNAAISQCGQNIIRKPKYYLEMGIVSISFLLSIVAFSIIKQLELEILLLVIGMILILCLPAIFMIVARLNWKIVVGEREFTIRNILGKENTYKYDSIDIKKEPAVTRFYQDGKLIAEISSLCVNKSCLEKAIREYNLTKDSTTF